MNKRLLAALLVLLLVLPAISVGNWGELWPFGWDRRTWRAEAPFRFTVKTDNAGTSNDDQFTLPLDGSSSYECLIEWGDGSTTYKTTNSSETHTYASAGTYTVEISGIFPGIYFNNGGDKLKLLTVENLGEVGWTSFELAFFGCSNMTSFTAGMTDTAAVTSMAAAFYNCGSLLSLDISSFDTSAVTVMNRMFSGCASLTSLDVSGFDTSAVTNMQYMFYLCSSLTSLDLTSFNTSAVTNMANMFQRCTVLAPLDLTSFNTAAVTDMQYMFRSCGALPTLDVTSFDTSAVTNMQYMFANCTLLDLDVSTFDITSMTNAVNMFALSSFSQTNYDLVLVAWEAQVEQPNVTFSAGSATYGAGAPATARAALVTNGWTITDGGAE